MACKAAPAVDEDRGASLSQARRCVQADAVGAAGDQGHLARHRHGDLRTA